MYLGPVVIPQKQYVDKYVPGIGTLPSYSRTVLQTYERYRCEACGREHRILWKAVEPFYCDCNELVQVTPLS